ncbi:MAG: SsrA-binding protein SmpB [Clostridia bacterium]|nr:SsrA-binding protein SmpB [Clostridia bacterium]
MKTKSEERAVIANNSKARHDYTIEDTLECGIALVGTEVKSIRNKKVNIKDSYAQVKNGELFILNMHISPYEEGSYNNVSPTRTRKLLANKREINKLSALVAQKGVTLVPTSVYFSKNHVKVEIAIAKGKKIYDKRQDIAKKDAERRMRQKAE